VTRASCGIVLMAVFTAGSLRAEAPKLKIVLEHGTALEQRKREQIERLAAPHFREFRPTTRAVRATSPIRTSTSP
jgi:hypothetical protein